jgi:hypothetical protein
VEAFTKLAIWLAPGLALALIVKFWDWLIHRIYGEPRPRVLIVLIFITVAIPAMIFVVIFNIDRARTLGDG